MSTPKVTRHRRPTPAPARGEGPTWTDEQVAQVLFVAAESTAFLIPDAIKRLSAFWRPAEAFTVSASALDRRKLQRAATAYVRGMPRTRRPSRKAVA